MKHWHVCLITVTLCAAPAQARPLDNLAQSAPAVSRVQVGVTIPFGGGGSEAERAPRLELWGERGQPGEFREARLRTEPDAAYPQQQRLGISFNRQPRLMINGREMPRQDNRHGISALGWVGIGLGVAVIAFGVFALDAFNKDNGLNGL
jgi:hypothetical protein